MTRLRQPRFKPACVIFCLFAAASSHAQQFTCQDLLDFQTEFDGKLPMQVDGFASLLELNIDCQNNIVEYVKRLKIDENQLARGFRSRKQVQYRELHCKDDGVANHGWSSVDKIYDKNDKPLVQLTATPEMCSIYILVPSLGLTLRAACGSSNTFPAHLCDDGVAIGGRAGHPVGRPSSGLRSF